MTYYASNLRKLTVPMLVALLTGCGAEALPKNAPETSLGLSISRAETAAAAAREAEQMAAAKLDESTKQLELAHKYLQRAEAAANLCKGNYGRVVANEAARKKADALSKKRAIAAAAAKKKEEELRLKAEEEAKAAEEAKAPKNKEPEFSKSDAP